MESLYAHNRGFSLKNQGDFYIVDEIKVIENELVPVYETSEGEKVVYGTDLYECLGSKRQYTDWINGRLSECDAIENVDYQSFSQKNEKPSGGRPRQEYLVKLDTAKEMAMLERNDKGKQVRRYFINVEKKYKKDKPKSALEQLQLQSQAILEVNWKIDDVKQDLEEFKRDMPLLAVECDRITTAVKKRGVNALGGKDSNAYNDVSLRGKVYQDIHRELKRQFGVSTYKAIKRNQCDLAVSIVDEYELPIVLTERIEDCNSQISMEV